MSDNAVYNANSRAWIFLSRHGATFRVADDPGAGAIFGRLAVGREARSARTCLSLVDVSTRDSALPHCVGVPPAIAID